MPALQPFRLARQSTHALSYRVSLVSSQTISEFWRPNTVNHQARKVGQPDKGRDGGAHTPSRLSAPRSSSAHSRTWWASASSLHRRVVGLRAAMISSQSAEPLHCERGISSASLPECELGHRRLKKFTLILASVEARSDAFEQLISNGARRILARRDPAARKAGQI